MSKRAPSAATSASAGRSVKPRSESWRDAPEASAPSVRRSPPRSRGARPVRRPHLAQDGAGLTHHVGDPEAAADFHQLAARNDHLAAVRRAPPAPAGPPRRCCSPRPPPRRRSVASAASRHAPCASPACPPRRRIPDWRSRGHLRDARECRRGDRRASQIGMDNDARRVDNRPERRRNRGAQTRFETRQNDGGGGLGVRGWVVRPASRSAGRLAGLLHRRVRRSRRRLNRRSAARATPQSHGGSPRASPRGRSAPPGAAPPLAAGAVRSTE